MCSARLSLRCRWLGRVSLAASVVVVAGLWVGCSDPVSRAGDGESIRPIGIELRVPDDVADALTVDVVGLAPSDLTAIRNAKLTRDEWQAVFRVSVGDQARDVLSLPAVLGSYTVGTDAVRFTPRFGFDPGRPYRVSFDPDALPAGVTASGPGRSLRALEVVVAALPADDAPSTTAVAGVYPTAQRLPENVLRMYIRFSAPMGREGGADYVRLLDATGQVVEDPFLPLDLALWNQDRTRYTLFFDPGRVKQGILPNQEMGRAISEGQTYTLVIDRGWPDSAGASLAASYSRTFVVAPPQDVAIDPSQWDVTPPTVGTRDPLVVSFPAPLDRALLRRALSVTTDEGRRVEGEIHVEAAETMWAFTPGVSWGDDEYRLTALSFLEDPSGNRIGRAFEVPSADGTSRPGEGRGVALSFHPVPLSR